MNKPRKPLPVNLTWTGGVLVAMATLYVLSLGPMLWFAERKHVPYSVWYVYYPVFKPWGSEWVPWDLQQLYYEDYLQWWTDYLPYDFLLDNGMLQ